VKRDKGKPDPKAPTGEVTRKSSHEKKKILQKLLRGRSGSRTTDVLGTTGEREIHLARRSARERIFCFDRDRRVKAKRI